MVVVLRPRTEAEPDVAIRFCTCVCVTFSVSVFRLSPVLVHAVVVNFWFVSVRARKTSPFLIIIIN